MLAGDLGGISIWNPWSNKSGGGLCLHSTSVVLLPNVCAVFRIVGQERQKVDTNWFELKLDWGTQTRKLGKNFKLFKDFLFQYRCSSFIWFLFLYNFYCISWIRLVQRFFSHWGTGRPTPNKRARFSPDFCIHPPPA